MLNEKAMATFLIVRLIKKTLYKWVNIFENQNIYESWSSFV